MKNTSQNTCKHFWNDNNVEYMIIGGTAVAFITDLADASIGMGGGINR